MPKKNQNLSESISKGIGVMFSANDTIKTQETQETQDAQELQETRKTQGRKGVSMPRVNVSLTPTAYDYVKTMASLRGMSQGEIIEEALKNDMELHQGEYDQAKKLLSQIRK